MGDEICPKMEFNLPYNYAWEDALRHLNENIFFVRHRITFPIRKTFISLIAKNFLTFLEIWRLAMVTLYRNTGKQYSSRVCVCLKKY